MSKVELRLNYGCPVCGERLDGVEMVAGLAITVNGGWTGPGSAGGTLVGAGVAAPPGSWVDKTEHIPSLDLWTFSPCGHQVEGQVELSTLPEAKK